MNNILTVNGGSSSLKCSLYRDDDMGLELLYTLKATDVLGNAKLSVADTHGHILETKSLFNEENPPSSADRHLLTLTEVIQWLRQFAPDDPITAISHRVVHGGDQFSAPITVTTTVLEQLQHYIPLAPLHQPYNLKLIESCASLLPQVPQLACFDTMFHSSQADVATAYAIPKWLSDKGVRRYGFHGLSYEFICHKLAEENQLKAKTIVAHLGAGTSLCAINEGKSVATTMGFSAAEGLPMATRTGAIDPGVLLFLLQHEKLSVEQVERLIYKESGWLGVSGISHDMQALLSSSEADAEKAINLFCYRTAREIGSLVAALQGLDQIIFTGGIGEHSAEIRARISEHCQWLGAKVNPDANRKNQHTISSKDSQIELLAVPTDEEYMLALHYQQSC